MKLKIFRKQDAVQLANILKFLEYYLEVNRDFMDEQSIKELIDGINYMKGCV